MPLLDVASQSLDEYVAAGGGRGLDVALGASPDAVIDEIEKSGLRGRGGAGFPTADKWRSIRSTGTGTRFAVCNGAEGEPATFKDRTLLRTNPYQVLEGLAIAAYAVGAERAFIGVKDIFGNEVGAVRRALDEMEQANALGPVSIELVLGPDLYLFGEETGLEEVIEGRLPLPRVARPFVFGLFAQPPNENPTLVNNVETLANVPHIMADGPDWLRSSGTDGSPGTMVFTVCGDVQREGVFELPLGTPLRHLVEDRAGGTPQGRSLKAIFPGASNTLLGPSELDVPMDFDSMREIGSGLGSAGFAVFDDSACMVRAAQLYSRFLFVESCGQCPACKFGTGEVTKLLEEVEAGNASDQAVESILMRARGSTDGQKCALPTGESLLIQSVVQVFGREFQDHLGGACPLPRELTFHRILDWDSEASRFVYDKGYASKRSDWTYGHTVSVSMTHEKVELMALEDRGWGELGALIDSMPADKVATTGYFAEGWSAKDLLAHIGSWLAQAGWALERIRFGTYRPEEIRVDEMNAEFYRAMKDVPFDTVRAQAHAARSRMLEAWGAALDDPEADVWIRKAGPEHYAEHLPRLREWVAELQAAGDDAP